MGIGTIGPRPAGPGRRSAGATPMRTPRKDRIMQAIASRLAGATWPDGASLAAELGLPAAEIDTFIGVCAGGGLLTLKRETDPPLVEALTRKGETYLHGAPSRGPG